MLKPASQLKPLTSWSYSRYSSYQQCPLKFRLQYLDKLLEPKSAAMERGTTIHGLAENYLKGVGRTVPGELVYAADELKRLRAKRKKDPQSVIVEDTWAFKKDWSGTLWNDWTGCYLRVKIDVAELTGTEVTITDVKTGKHRPDNKKDYLEQLHLYGTATLAVFSHVPELTVKARLVYVDAATTFPAPGEEEVYTQKDLPALKKDWEKRVKPMFADKRFAPRPNQWCKWCHYRKDNGGPCSY